MEMGHLLLRSKFFIFHNIFKILHFKGAQRRLCGVKELDIDYVHVVTVFGQPHSIMILIRKKASWENAQNFHKTSERQLK